MNTPAESYNGNSTRPNIIVILVDALRPDHLCCCGYERPTSPSLDEFAEDSILFENAFSASPITRSSIPSILTGLYPSLHGTGSKKTLLTLNKDVPCLAEVLKQQGYTTVGFNTNPFVGAKQDYDRGFSLHFDMFPCEENKSFSCCVETLSDGVPQKEDLKFPQPYICSRGVNKSVSHWLRNSGRQPFFMWIHYMDTHSPYLPREPHFLKYSKGESGLHIMTFLRQFYALCNALNSRPDSLTQEQKSLFVNCYDSEINYFDRSFGELAAVLKELDLFDNTVVIVTADHGEEFWEHGGWGHSLRMYDVNLRVPLLLKPPGNSLKGKTVPNQAQNIDIFPTILDILDIEPEYHLSGRSLVSLINEPSQVPVLAEGGGPVRISENQKVSHFYALRSPEYKYIKDAAEGHCRLYQLQSDPLESNNLADRPFAKQIISDFEGQLMELLRPVTNIDEQSLRTELDSVTLERLKALGYV